MKLGLQINEGAKEFFGQSSAHRRGGQERQTNRICLQPDLSKLLTLMEVCRVFCEMSGLWWRICSLSIDFNEILS